MMMRRMPTTTETSPTACRPDSSPRSSCRQIRSKGTRPAPRQCLLSNPPQPLTPGAGARGLRARGVAKTKKPALSFQKRASATLYVQIKLARLGSCFFAHQTSRRWTNSPCKVSRGGQHLDHAHSAVLTILALPLHRPTTEATTETLRVCSRTEQPTERASLRDSLLRWPAQVRFP